VTSTTEARSPLDVREEIEQAWLDGFNEGVGEMYWDVDPHPQKRAKKYADEVVARLASDSTPEQEPDE
jgi:hypothetical protein